MAPTHDEWELIADMVTELEYSEPGKRQWIDCISPTKSWTYNYNITKRSTFPSWFSFFPIRRPKNISKPYYKKGYYQGTSKELIWLLYKAAYQLKMTERQEEAVEQAITNYKDYLIETKRN
jgi:hypothetical protein